MDVSAGKRRFLCEEPPTSMPAKRRPSRTKPAPTTPGARGRVPRRGGVRADSADTASKGAFDLFLDVLVASRPGPEQPLQRCLDYRPAYEQVVETRLKLRQETAAALGMRPTSDRPRRPTPATTPRWDSRTRELVLHRLASPAATTYISSKTSSTHRSAAGSEAGGSSPLKMPLSSHGTWDSRLRAQVLKGTEGQRSDQEAPLITH